MKLFDRTPNHGGEAYLGGYDRDWNPYWTRAKRAAWFKQFDNAKAKLLERSDAKLARVSDEYAREALDRMRHICESNDLNDTNRPLLLSGADVATLDIYINSLRSAENDYATLSETMLGSLGKARSIQVEINRLDRRLRRNVITVIVAVVASFSFGVFVASFIN